MTMKAIRRAPTDEEFRKIKLAAAIELRKKHRGAPCLGFIPNRGQEKAVRVYKEKNDTNYGAPFVNVFSGGNGVGKTTMLVNFMIGLCYGSRAMNPFFKDYFIFKKMEMIRRTKQRPIKGRILCQAEGMKNNGAVKGEIEKWFPKGRGMTYKMTKAGKTYYSEIHCFVRNEVTKKDELIAVVEIKTFDMDIVAHAGANLDFILCDEPPPEDIYTENIARLRNGGIYCFFLTPLNMAGWMVNQILNDIDGVNKTFANASLWDNVKDGRGMDGTRGHLEREDVLRLIREWKRSSPHEVEARVAGKFTHLKGSIYKLFKEEVHTIPDNRVTKANDWPVVMVIDPHDARPPAIGWFVEHPLGTICWKVWPEEDYTKIDANWHTIEMVCEEIQRIESEEFGRPADRRLCDPNKLNYNYPNTNLTVAEEYAKSGIELEASDDNLEIGHSRVNQFLYYRENEEVNARNTPKMLFRSEASWNAWNAIMNYGWKKNAESAKTLSGKLSQEYKDFADIVRYYVIMWEPFQAIKNGANSFVEKIKGSRKF